MSSTDETKLSFEDIHTLLFWALPIVYGSIPRQIMEKDVPAISKFKQWVSTHSPHIDLNDYAERLNILQMYVTRTGDRKKDIQSEHMCSKLYMYLYFTPATTPYSSSISLENIAWLLFAGLEYQRQE